MDVSDWVTSTGQEFGLDLSEFNLCGKLTEAAVLALAQGCPGLTSVTFGGRILPVHRKVQGYRLRKTVGRPCAWVSGHLLLDEWSSSIG